MAFEAAFLAEAVAFFAEAVALLAAAAAFLAAFLAIEALLVKDLTNFLSDFLIEDDFFDDFLEADLPYFDVCISNTPYQVIHSKFYEINQIY